MRASFYDGVVTATLHARLCLVAFLLVHLTRIFLWIDEKTRPDQNGGGCSITGRSIFLTAESPIRIPP